MEEGHFIDVDVEVYDEVLVLHVSNVGNKIQEFEFTHTQHNESK